MTAFSRASMRGSTDLPPNTPSWNPPEECGVEPPQPERPPVSGGGSNVADAYNCIGNAVGGNPGGPLIPPVSPGAGAPSGPLWCDPPDAVAIFDDECWEEVDCEGGPASGPGGGNTPPPEGTVVVVESGLLDENGDPGPVTNIAHATVVTDSAGNTRDKNGLGEEEPSKPLDDVISEHTEDQGFTDPDEDGVFEDTSDEDGDGARDTYEYRRVKCYKFKEDCQ